MVASSFENDGFCENIVLTAFLLQLQEPPPLLVLRTTNYEHGILVEERESVLVRLHQHHSHLRVVED